MMKAARQDALAHRSEAGIAAVLRQWLQNPELHCGGCWTDLEQKLVVLEGTDGAGKTTVADHIIRALEREGLRSAYHTPLHPPQPPPLIASILDRNNHNMVSAAESLRNGSKFIDSFSLLDSFRYSILLNCMNESVDSHDIYIVDSWYFKRISKFLFLIGQSLSPFPERCEAMAARVLAAFSFGLHERMGLFFELPPGEAMLRKVGGLTAWDNIELREAERRNAEGGPTTTAETHLATIAAARGWFKIESGNARSPQEVAELAVERILLTLGGRAAPTPSQ